MSVSPDKEPTHKTHEPIIGNMSKTDHEVFGSTVSDQSHDKTVTKHIEYNEPSSGDVVQQGLIGGIYFQSIFHNLIKLLNFQKVSYPSMMKR